MARKSAKWPLKESALDTFIRQAEELNFRLIHRGNTHSLLCLADEIIEHDKPLMWLLPLASMLNACHEQIEQWEDLTDRIGFCLELGAVEIVREGCAQSCDAAMAQIISEWIETFPFGEVLEKARVERVLPRIPNRDELIDDALRAERRFVEYGSEDCLHCIQVVKRWLECPTSASASANAIMSLLESWYCKRKPSLYEHSVFQNFQLDLEGQRQHFRKGQELLSSVLNETQMSWMRETFDPVEQ